ncbi:hypothetical protein MIZ03_0829 [Rhodoferax lithotrophicus]|uniref:Uncharacterized protein n=1 Tax=Rhodoferax lithotrophicus TaxID=2798804 RepID=A0ABN6D1U6_9BURK|nr:hypothetical protein [Rhodoferax sp. MIZ03]BCO25950.1 hypothetical protein MIZ03_0829 [Rhodoferax sp. MIZ03]
MSYWLLALILIAQAAIFLINQLDSDPHYPYVKLGAGSASWPFDNPQYLLLNLAIGGDMGGPVDNSIFPLQIEVDDVRAYQKL